jgi:hypothetical protein
MGSRLASQDAETAGGGQPRYAVASARLGPATLSAGWGTGPDRMEGAFAGGALTLLPGLEALAEWETSNVNAGVRFSLPLHRIGLPVRIGGLAMSALDRRPRTIEWGASAQGRRASNACGAKHPRRRADGGSRRRTGVQSGCRRGREPQVPAYVARHRAGLRTFLATPVAHTCER